METKLKQRVIGALLITTITVIVLPMLLDGSPEERARINTTIPDAPKIAIKNLTVQQVKEAMLEQETQSAAKLPEDIPDPKLALEEIVEDNVEGIDTEKNFQLDKNNLPVSWSLQLGSFKQKNNAIKLRKSLRDAEYRSYILKANSLDTEVYRVFVGPILSIEKIKGFATDIESDFEMKGQVVRYKIEDDVNQLEG